MIDDPRPAPSDTSQSPFGFALLAAGLGVFLPLTYYLLAGWIPGSARIYVDLTCLLLSFGGLVFAFGRFGWPMLLTGGAGALMVALLGLGFGEYLFLAKVDSLQAMAPSRLLNADTPPPAAHLFSLPQGFSAKDQSQNAVCQAVMFHDPESNRYGALIIPGKAGQAPGLKTVVRSPFLTFTCAGAYANLKQNAPVLRQNKHRVYQVLRYAHDVDQAKTVRTLIWAAFLGLLFSGIVLFFVLNRIRQRAFLEEQSEYERSPRFRGTDEIELNDPRAVTVPASNKIHRGKDPTFHLDTPGLVDLYFTQNSFRLRVDDRMFLVFRGNLQIKQRNQARWIRPAQTATLLASALALSTPIWTGIGLGGALLLCLIGLGGWAMIGLVSPKETLRINQDQAIRTRTYLKLFRKRESIDRAKRQPWGIGLAVSQREGQETTLLILQGEDQDMILFENPDVDKVDTARAFVQLGMSYQLLNHWENHPWWSVPKPQEFRILFKDMDLRTIQRSQVQSGKTTPA